MRIWNFLKEIQLKNRIVIDFCENGLLKIEPEFPSFFYKSFIPARGFELLNPSPSPTSYTIDLKEIHIKYSVE